MNNSIDFSMAITIGELLSLILPLGIGIFLARYTLFARRDFQRVEALNRVAFALMECRWGVESQLSSDKVDMPELLWERLDKKMPGFKDALDDVTKDKFTSILEEIARSAESQFSDTPYLSIYTNAIDELSKVEPILAFEISARGNWKKVFQLMDQHLEPVREVVMDQIPDVHEITMSDFMDNSLHEKKAEMSEILRKDISRILRKVSFMKWALLKIRAFVQKDVNYHDELIREIDHSIDTHIIPLTKQLTLEAEAHHKSSGGPLSQSAM